MRTVCVSSVICLILSACSPASVVRESQVGQTANVRCEQVVPTGSIMPRKICTTAAERNRDLKDAQATLEERERMQQSQAIMERAMRRETYEPIP